MFDPNEAQIKRFLNELLDEYKIKEIERNEGSVAVTVETMWESTDDKGKKDKFPIDDVLTLTEDEIDFGDFPGSSSEDHELYEKWLLANGFHKLLKDNPFLLKADDENKKEVRWEIGIPKDTYDDYARLFEGSPDYEENDVPRYATLERFTKNLGGNLEMDAKICTGDDGDAIWSETVLFDHGCEIGCSDVGDSMEDELWVEHDGTLYKTRFVKLKAEMNMK